MKDVYKQIQLEVENNNKCIVVTIIDKKGSIPQEIGATMLVSKEVYGTIGGGNLEANCIQFAREMLVNNEDSKRMKFNLQEPPFNMVCGGSCEVFFNVINSSPNLYVFGSGHVARAIYDVFSHLAFNLIVIDDREELLNYFTNTICVDYNDLNIDCSDSYVVVATRSHSLDFKVVESIKNQTYKYLGVLGSKKKVSEMLENIEIDKTNLYAPVGLKVSNQNPHEIAISIASEILAHKNNKLGKLNDH